MLVHLCEVQDLEPCKGHRHTMLVCVVGSYNILYVAQEEWCVSLGL